MPTNYQGSPPNICGGIHTCMRCRKQLPRCSDPTWLCPWLNEDENQECPECAEITKKEMEEAYNSQ